MPMGPKAVKIVPFDDALAEDFAKLNYHWIEEHFVVESHDREMLDDPRAYIIDHGGEIFFAMAEGKAVGTAALIDAGEKGFELAKMAVSPEHRGLGIGDKLMSACIEHARAKGKTRIFLLSNTKLAPAIGLYRKHGFTEMAEDEISPYERVDIKMELALNYADM